MPKAPQGLTSKRKKTPSPPSVDTRTLRPISPTYHEEEEEKEQEKEKQENLIFLHTRLLANHSIFLIQHKEEGRI